MYELNDSYILSVLKKRPIDAHKGNFGKMLIFAGSIGMAGAALLCGKAALKSGAGLVQFLVTSFESPLYPIFQISIPCATCVEYNKPINWQQYNAIAVGPGLGKTQTVKNILADILENYHGTLVLDADALNIISEMNIHTVSSDIIMTPHIGEAKRLLHCNSPIISEAERIHALKSIANVYHSTVVLKGYRSIVGNTTEYHINTTGNPGMATGGAGDALTGIITALAAQGYDSYSAASVGMYIHGKAGDIAADKLGEMGLTAMDIVESVPYAFNIYYKEL